MQLAFGSYFKDSSLFQFKNICIGLHTNDLHFDLNFNNTYIYIIAKLFNAIKTKSSSLLKHT